MSSMTGEGLLRTTEQSTRPFQDSLRSGSLRPPPNSPSIRSSQSSIHFFTPLDRFANGFLPSSPVRPSQVFGEIADLGRPVQPTLSLPARHHELQSLLGQDEETGLLPRPRQDSGHEDLDGEENEVKTVRSFVFGGRLIPRTRSSISRPACHVTSLMAENVRRLLTTNLYHTSGLVFVPLGFISHSLGWDQATVVALNALAAGACAFLATALFEHLRPTWHAQVPKSSLIGDIVWTNPAWLCIGMLSLLAHDYQTIQLIIPGSILTRNLLGLGMGFCAGGLTQRVQRYNDAAISVTASAKVVGLIPLVLCSLLAVACRGDDGNPNPTRETDILFFSRGAALVSLLVYTLYWLFRNITHAYLFSDETAHPGHTTAAHRATSSPPPPTARAALVATLALTFCTLALPIHSTLLVRALQTPPPPPPSSSSSSSPALFSPNPTFVRTILLPLLLHHHELVAAARAAHASLPDRALLAAEGATLHATLFVVPSLVVLGWIFSGRGSSSSSSSSGHRVMMTLEMPVVPLVMAAAGAWLSGVVLRDGRSNYLKGAVLLVLYTSTAIATFLLP